MTIGERIKQRRIELGMTQQELAEKVGYKTKVAICNIEQNDRTLMQNKIKPMAEALETTVSYIMGWDTEEELTNELENVCHGMDEDQISKIIEYAKFIKSQK